MAFRESILCWKSASGKQMETGNACAEPSGILTQAKCRCQTYRTSLVAYVRLRKLLRLYMQIPATTFKLTFDEFLVMNAE